MDKPAPNNPHLHDWLDTTLSRTKPFDPFQFDQRMAMESLSAGFGPLKALTVYQMALVQLASRRAQAYLGVPQRLSRCRTHQDVMEEQMRFWQTAMGQYQDSLNLITKAWSEAFAMPAQMAAQGMGFPGQPGDSQSGLIKFPSSNQPNSPSPTNGSKPPSRRLNA